MLDTVRVGIAQWLPAPGRADLNLKTALAAVAELGKAACDLIVLPELWLSGCDPVSMKDDVVKTCERLEGPAITSLRKEAAKHRTWIAAGSIPECADGLIFNTATLIDRSGAIRGVHRKAHLYHPMGEHRAVSSGSSITTITTTDFGPVGLAICFDGDFPEVAREMRARGVRFVIQVSAYESQAETWWDTLYRAHAITNGQWWIMANQCGRNSSVSLLGKSQIIGPLGDVKVRARRVKDSAAATESAGYERELPTLLMHDIDAASELTRSDAQSGVLWNLRRPDIYTQYSTREID